jgi:hypothetical protein
MSITGVSIMVSTKFKPGDKVRYCSRGFDFTGVVGNDEDAKNADISCFLKDTYVVWAYWKGEDRLTFINEEDVTLIRPKVRLPEYL